MFSSTNAKLQQLAVKNKVPAWSVMVDLRRGTWENEHREVLVLLGEKGRILSSIEISSYDVWGRIEVALKEYAATEECRSAWARYEAEGCPVVGTLGLPL
ncbi:TPA: hypothetical protein MB364_000876 [Klebsiella variicola subsp. variicola]|nr:hypothetical protein [Klebsiella variicola subsp. variicola]